MRALEALLDALAGNGHQAEIVELENLVGSPVGAHGFFEGLHDFLAVFALIHIDEIDHDDSAEIAQPDLTHNLFDRVSIGLDDGVFEAVGAADEFAGIDVDGHQSLGLVDDDMAAGLQPDLGAQGFFNLLGDPELVEDGGGSGVELDAGNQSGLKALDEAQHVFVDVLIIDPDALEGGGELVAQDTLDHVEIVVYQGRGRTFFGLLPQVEPEVVEELHVGAQLFFSAPVAGADAPYE